MICFQSLFVIILENISSRCAIETTFCATSLLSRSTFSLTNGLSTNDFIVKRM